MLAFGQATRVGHGPRRLLTTSEQLGIVGSSAEVMKRVNSQVQCHRRARIVCRPGIHRLTYTFSGRRCWACRPCNFETLPRRPSSRAASAEFALWRDGRNVDSQRRLGPRALGRRIARRGSGSTGETARHPVWVRRLDGHMALANTAALPRRGHHARDGGRRRPERSSATRAANQQVSSRTTRSRSLIGLPLRITTRHSTPHSTPRCASSPRRV